MPLITIFRQSQYPIPTQYLTDDQPQLCALVQPPAYLFYIRSIPLSAFTFCLSLFPMDPVFLSFFLLLFFLVQVSGSSDAKAFIRGEGWKGVAIYSISGVQFRTLVLWSART